MATFFGEVIYPSSRAFFDDYDDSDADEGDSVVDIKPHLLLRKLTDCICKEYKAIIISDGQITSKFTNDFMLEDEAKLIAEFVSPKGKEDVSNILIVKPKEVVTSKLYLLKNLCLLLQVSPTLDISLANQLTVLLSPWLTVCKEVIILASFHNANFRCDSINDLPSAFVRGLSTSANSLPEGLKHLEQPNFISNAPASILSWCEGQGKRGLLLALYSDRTDLDLVTFDALVEAFKKADLMKYIVNSPPTLRIKQGILNDTNKTFMYM